MSRVFAVCFGPPTTTTVTMADENPQPRANEEEEDAEYEGTSIRWKHFSTSYKLAAKKISMGWS